MPLHATTSQATTEEQPPRERALQLILALGGSSRYRPGPVRHLFSLPFPPPSRLRKHTAMAALPSRPPLAGRHPAALRSTLVLLLVVPLATAGCAGWRPWRNRDKESRLAEKYGSTANPRIETLQKDAKKAKNGSGADQVTFTRDLMRQLLEEHDPRVRGEIVQTASKFDTPAAVAICKGALQDPDERVRTVACEVWGERGGAEAVQLLGQRFQSDSELDVRLRALRMLGKLENKDAIPVLAMALEDPDPAVQYRAVVALKAVSGRDLGNDVNAWRAWAADPAADRNEWSIAEQFRKLF